MTSLTLFSALVTRLKSSSSTNTPSSTPSTVHSETFTPWSATTSRTSLVSSLQPEDVLSSLQFTTFPPPSLTQQALSYLRTQVPYHPAALGLAQAYHLAHRRRRGSMHEQVAADLACGAAQLAVWAAASGHFASVHARDVDEEMVQLARGTSQMNQEQRSCLDLPFSTEEVWHIGVGSALQPNIQLQSIDMLMIGSAAHLFDWSTSSSTSSLYNTWSHLLRPHGTLLLLCTRPVPCSPRTQTLRSVLELAPFATPLAPYFDASAARLGAVSMHASLPMPWDSGVEAHGWDSASRVYTVFDCVDGLPDKGKIPRWLSKQVKKQTSVQGEQDGLGEKWSLSTPRALADWLRSTTGYARYLSSHPAERAAAGVDADYAARTVREACAVDGVGYDEPVPMRYPTAVLLLKRDASVPSLAP